MRELPLALARAPIGQLINLLVWHQGKETAVALTIGQAPSEAIAATATGKAPIAKAGLGLTLVSLTSRWRADLSVPAAVTGAVVTAIAEDGYFGDADLQPGDVIQEVDQQPTPSLVEVRARLKRDIAGNAARVLLLIFRDGHELYSTAGAASPAVRKQTG